MGIGIKVNLAVSCHSDVGKDGNIGNGGALKL
jgi:hypothetical protein